MNVYLDTSGLAKPYLGETGAHLVRAAVETADVAATSVIALPEVFSGVARSLRNGTITVEQSKAIREAFLTDWPRFFRIAVREETVVLAADLVTRWPLRAFDAVHLASAMSWRVISRQRVAFICFDRQLRTAARGEGLWLLPDDSQLQ